MVTAILPNPGRERNVIPADGLFFQFRNRRATSGGRTRLPGRGHVGIGIGGGRLFRLFFEELLQAFESKAKPAGLRRLVHTRPSYHAAADRNMCSRPPGRRHPHSTAPDLCILFTPDVFLPFDLKDHENCRRFDHFPGVGTPTPSPKPSIHERSRGSHHRGQNRPGPGGREHHREHRDYRLVHQRERRNHAALRN